MKKMILTGLLALLMVSQAYSRIKLVALPERAHTAVRLDNPAHTVIQEKRVLALQAGVNQVDFAWAGVQIDVDSIRLEVMDSKQSVKLLNISYPPEGNALVWEIYSDQPRQQEVTISYLLNMIDRLVTYKAIANSDESEIFLRSYVVLRNFSGEDFYDAQVILEPGQQFDASIRNEETRQVLFLSLDEVPIKKIWTFDARNMIWDPAAVPGQNVGIPVSYRIVNDKASKLGQGVLWDGKVRVYQKDNAGSTIFLGEDNAALTAVGEEMELNIGNSRDIVVTQKRMESKEVNRKYSSETDTRARRVVMYDKEEFITAKIENFKDSPATLTMIQEIPGQWKMLDCNMAYTKKSSNVIEFEIELPARDGDKSAVVNLEMRYIIENIRTGQQPRIMN